MIETGMSVRLDTAGNIMADTLELSPSSCLSDGSHIDTVRWGRYDGHLESWQDWKSCVS